MRGFLQARLNAISKAGDDFVLALANARHVNSKFASADAIIGASPSKVGDTAARDHRLGWRAAFVDAGAAHMLALNQYGFVPRVRQRQRQWIGSLSGTDNNGVVVFWCGHEWLLVCGTAGDSE